MAPKHVFAMHSPTVLFLLAHVSINKCLAGSGMMRREKVDSSPIGKAAESILEGKAEQRKIVVENILRPMYDAFPKNVAGKIAAQALDTTARGYFAEEHGWLFTGFEFSGARSTSLAESTLLQERAPGLVDTLKSAVSGGEGLSLNELVSTIVAVEHLVSNDCVPLLPQAYVLNRASWTGRVQRQQLEEIIMSFMMLFREGSKVSKKETDFMRHQAKKTEIRKGLDWTYIQSFFTEALERYGIHTEYTSEDASEIIRDMMLRYGKWQNSECQEMKKALINLDSTGTGRVHLETFHSAPANAHFAFTETADFLRNVSALDESRAGSPRVMIANYLGSVSNCIAWSQHFSVCCLNQCENLMNELEGRVQTSDVPVDQLIEAVAGISSSSVRAPRALSPRLEEMAHAIAGVHGGVVPLMSGDFRRWFHFAFPNECAFPTELEAEMVEAERDASERWLAAGSEEIDV